jgi:hypothetical protein
VRLDVANVALQWQSSILHELKTAAAASQVLAMWTGNVQASYGAGAMLRLQQEQVTICSVLQQSSLFSAPVCQAGRCLQPVQPFL